MNDWSSISVVIITRNAESTLASALESIPAKAEIIVADADSTDKTVSIAHSFGARIIRQDQKLITAAGGNFDVARNQAMNLASRKWLFILDSDEQISGTLAKEITETIQKDHVHAGYNMPRKNLFWGKEVRLLGEDRQVRLLLKGKGRYSGQRLHCPIRIDGTIGPLQGSLIHQNIRCWSDVSRRFRCYLPIERKGKTPAANPLLVLRVSLRMARYYLFRQQAWRDGWRGILTCCIYGVYHGLIYWPGKK